MLPNLAARLDGCPDLESIVGCALEAGLELMGATLGNVQLMDWRAGSLTIAAQRGFDEEFLDFFRRVKADDGSACGRALRRQQAVVIEDVMSDEAFAPCCAIAQRAGFRSVQSTPLVSTNGAFLGVLSTHFQRPHRPTESEMKALRALARLAANAIIVDRVRVKTKGSVNATMHCINRARAAIERSRAILNRVV